MQSKSNKGIALELSCSKKFHSLENTIGLLISSTVLRRRNCGQIDLVRINKKIIEVCEVKKRSLNNRHGTLSYKQKNRLRRSCNFLGMVFEKSVLLKIWEC